MKTLVDPAIDVADDGIKREGDQSMYEVPMLESTEAIVYRAATMQMIRGFKHPESWKKLYSFAKGLSEKG